MSWYPFREGKSAIFILTSLLNGDQQIFLLQVQPILEGFCGPRKQTGSHICCSSLIKWQKIMEVYPYKITLLHSEWPNLHSFGCSECNRDTKAALFTFLTLLHSKRPKLYTILAFLSASGLKQFYKYIAKIFFPTLLYEECRKDGSYISQLL